MFKFYIDSLRVFSLVPISVFTRLRPLANVSRGVDPVMIRIWKKWSGVFLMNKSLPQILDPLQSGFHVIPSVLWASRKHLPGLVARISKITRPPKILRWMSETVPFIGPVLAIAWTWAMWTNILVGLFVCFILGCILLMGVDTCHFILYSINEYFWNDFVYWSYMLPFLIYDLPWSEGLGMLWWHTPNEGLPLVDPISDLPSSWSGVLIDYFLGLLLAIFFNYLFDSAVFLGEVLPSVIDDLPVATSYWEMFSHGFNLASSILYTLIWCPYMEQIVIPWCDIFLNPWDLSDLIQWSADTSRAFVRMFRALINIIRWS
jgi:hypothetical protein